MGLLDKLGKSQTKESESKLSKKELEFILVKLRTATYKGDEFETFYNVWVKITDEIDKITQSEKNK
jgi:lipopolysaccharide biosynthesis protein